MIYPKMEQHPFQHSTVHEFQILYSSRISQKDKKWCDGKLKYYEVNNKLEVFNEDDLLVETDFFDSKKKDHVLEKKLIPNNEFKLNNGNLVISIIEALGRSVRDATCCVPTHIPSNTFVAQERISNIPLSNMPNYILRSRRAGLKVTKNQNNYLALKVGSLSSRTQSLPGSVQGYNSSTKSNNKEEKTKAVSSLNKRRIPPYSSSYFQYLHNEWKSGPTRDFSLIHNSAEKSQKKSLSTEEKNNFTSKHFDRRLNESTNTLFKSQSERNEVVIKQEPANP